MHEALRDIDDLHTAWAHRVEPSAISRRKRAKALRLYSKLLLVLLLLVLLILAYIPVAAAPALRLFAPWKSSLRSFILGRSPAADVGSEVEL